MIFSKLLGWTGLSLNSLIIFGVASAIFAGYFFYSQNQIKNYASQVAIQEIALQESKKQINSLKSDIAMIQKINKQLAVTKERAVKNYNDLVDKLAKLNNISAKHSKWLEDIINAAVKERNRCLAIASGSPVTEEDKKNRVCPNLVK